MSSHGIITSDEIQAFMAQPASLYALSPLARALSDALREMESKRADIPPHEWARIKESLTQAVQRPDYHLAERGHARMRLTDAQRTALSAQMGDVRISGRIVEFTVLQDAAKFVLDDAEVRAPATGAVLLSRDEGQRLLVLAAHTRCFAADER